MATSFTRQLGYEPGVQLNPTIDRSEGFATNAVEDQSFGCVARLARGPIDRAFIVAKSDVRVVTGQPEPNRKNPLNDAHGQLIEALQKGAKTAVVSRLVGSDASNKWVVVKKPTLQNDGYDLAFELSEQIPDSNFIFAFKHKGCFSDGIKVSLSAKEVRNTSDVAIDSKEVSFKLLDKSGAMILGFNASLDIENLDDNGLPYNLQTVAENFNSNDIEIVLAANAVIPKECAAYGKNANGLQKVQVSSVLYPFNEGNINNIQAADYKEAARRLKETNEDFVYISTLGSGSTSLISELYQLAFDKNIGLVVDIPNDLTPKQAIAWKAQTGITSHLVSFLWHPVECTDPNGVSGRVKFGSGAYRIALSCLRNAAINQMGFCKKNYAVAGRQFPIQRVGMKQSYKPTQDELSDLAKAGITPVIYETFSGGGLFIFDDAVTASGKQTSYLNLVNSVEIATTLERDIARMAKESFMFGPMEEAIKIAERMIKKHLENAETSGWLVKSQELEGNSFIVDIRPSAQRPADVMVINVRMRVEGCVRQVHITNEITR